MMIALIFCQVELESLKDFAPRGSKCNDLPCFEQLGPNFHSKIQIEFYKKKKDKKERNLICVCGRVSVWCV